jgi:type VI protein secretion system component VasK
LRTSSTSARRSRRPPLPRRRRSDPHLFARRHAQLQQAPAPQSRRGGTRKVPQWVFLPHLFSKILLADKSALESQPRQHPDQLLKRTLLACHLRNHSDLLALFTISFFRNRSLEARVAAAAERRFPRSRGQHSHRKAT